nr:MAG TPA: hypothetical protein [Caudoviricetes sp.]
MLSTFINKYKISIFIFSYLSGDKLWIRTIYLFGTYFLAGSLQTFWINLP